jgi:hypothetical protein
MAENMLGIVQMHPLDAPDFAKQSGVRDGVP